MESAIIGIENTIGRFLNSELSQINWELKVDASKWSKKEILGHLIDSANINLQRFVRCTYEENFKLRYEQVEYVKVQQYQNVPIEDLITLWRLLNQQIVRVLKNYPESRREALCDTGKNEIQLHTVEFLAEDYLVHLIHHLSQITLNY
jgi:hypothetical protein